MNPPTIPSAAAIPPPPAASFIQPAAFASNAQNARLRNSGRFSINQPVLPNPYTAQVNPGIAFNGNFWNTNGQSPASTLFNPYPGFVPVSLPPIEPMSVDSALVVSEPPKTHVYLSKLNVNILIVTHYLNRKNLSIVNCHQ